jgi:predicted TIM-barrel fold metal-dependent hydrolase
MAQTPWGEIRISDSHVHFFSYPFYEALAQQKKVAGPAQIGALLDWEIPPTDPTALAHKWVAAMDAKQVQRAALIASVPGDEASVAAAVSAYPDRFYGYFMFDPTQPDALDRMRKAASDPNLHCLCLFPAMHTYAVTDARLVPILELASDTHMTVFVHCGALSVGVRKKLGLPSQFNLKYSNPLDLHPVALHFPQVQFVIPHFGAGMLRETLMLADLCPNVFLDTSSSNHWMAYEGLDLRTVYRRSLEVVGPGRLLFGTDSSFFPRGWHEAIFDQHVKALYELGIEEDQVRQVLHANLEKLYAKRKERLG